MLVKIERNSSCIRLVFCRGDFLGGGYNRSGRPPISVTEQQHAELKAIRNRAAAIYFSSEKLMAAYIGKVSIDCAGMAAEMI